MTTIVETSSDELQSKSKELEDLRKLIQELYHRSVEGISTDDDVNLECVCKCHKERKSFKPIDHHDVDTQTFESDFQSLELSISNSSRSALDWVPENNSVTVADLVTDITQSQQNDYIYDENFGMHYSPSTGYYYDSKTTLFYEPYSQTYLRYDKEKNIYEKCQDNGESMSNEVDNMDLTETPKDKSRSKKLKKKVTDVSKCLQKEYIYDERYQMYYCPSTGYYFDSKSGLFYDPYSQSYLRYNSDKSLYEKCYDTNVECISSKVSDMELTESSNDKDRTKKKKQKANYKVDKQEKVEDKAKELENIKTDRNSKRRSSLEEGEIVSDSASSSSSSEEVYWENNDDDSVDWTQGLGSPQKWPPCIRAIVKSSSSQKIGSLIVIPCTGGVIGRELTCDICIPDASISREHAMVTFDKDSWQYNVADLNSQNGTIVNNIKVTGSDPHPLNHGETLELGSCTLLVHIHEGSNTCRDCEPGLVQAELNSKQEENAVRNFEDDKEQDRRQTLKQMKKKFGLGGMDFIPTSVPKKYQDRSQIRRKEKGSQNPYEKDEQPVSLDTALTSSNKGFKMLKKMGWNEGQSLGLNDSGLTEPVSLSSTIGTCGLGSQPATLQPAVPEDFRKRKWKKAQKRYAQVENRKNFAEDF